MLSQLFIKTLRDNLRHQANQLAHALNFFHHSLVIAALVIDYRFVKKGLDFLLRLLLFLWA